MASDFVSVSAWAKGWVSAKARLSDLAMAMASR